MFVLLHDDATLGGDKHHMYCFMYTCHQSNTFFANRMSVFSNLSNVRWGFIYEIKNINETENAIWDIEWVLTAKWNSWNMPWASDRKNG